MKPLIPVYQPSLNGNESKYVADCLSSGWISSKGKYVQAFESEFARYTGLKYATAVCNGTIALHLALVALGIGKGDEVIVPTLTYIASVNSIVYTGAAPVFVDSCSTDWQIDVQKVESAITQKTKAVMAVHLYGHPCKLEALRILANQYNLFLIEDCAEAIGSLYQEKHVGSFGDVATFSFYGNKTITTGEGGMLLTNDKTLFDRALHLKGQGLAKHREYWHDIIGYNYRMTNICAAIGLAQLERIAQILSRKRHVFQEYQRNLVDSRFIIQPEASNVFHSYWMISILVPDADYRDQIRERLFSDGIETRPVFYPVHTMPMYSNKYQIYPVAQDIGSRGVNLPSFPDLTDTQIEFICHSLQNALSPN